MSVRSPDRPARSGAAAPPAVHGAHGTLLFVGSRTLETVHGPFRAHAFRNLATGRFVLAVARGELGGEAPLLARVHSSCVTSETFGACDCDCAQQLEGALERIAAEGRGVVFYLLQEGRGAGFAAKVRDRMIVQASRDRVTTFEAYERMGLGRDYRRYDDIVSALRLLDVVAPLRLLTNNPEKLAALEREGVPIAGTAPIRHAPSPFNVHYLDAKSRSGHALDEANPSTRPARLPGPVSVFDPVALPETPRFVHVARYYLPVAFAGDVAPRWFELHAYHDLFSGLERVVLVHAARSGGVPLVRVQREALLERFPLGGDGTRRDAWRASARRIGERGAGVVLFLPIGGSEAEIGPAGSAPAPTEPLDEETAALLLRHLPVRQVESLVVPGDPPADNTTLCRVLERAGVVVDGRVPDAAA